MTLKYSSIHNIERASPGTEVVLTTAQANTNTDDAHVNLLATLKRAFHLHSKKQFGYFEKEQTNNNPLPAWLSDYYRKKISFTQLNQLVAKKFQKQLAQIPPAELFKHYLWVVTEEILPRNDIYIFLLKHDDSYHISKQLCVVGSDSINPEKLKFAAKIDLNEYINNQTKTYLSFLSHHTRNAVTRAFNNTIGFAEGIDRAAQTDDFLEVVEQYSNDVSDNNHECRNRIVDYCLEQNRQGEPVELKALSRHVDDSDPEAFMRYLADHLDQPSTELYADRNRLKRYTRFYGRDHDLSISFSTVMFGSKIIYDERSETLTIRSIPESLKSQLKKYTKKVS